MLIFFLFIIVLRSFYSLIVVPSLTKDSSSKIDSISGSASHALGEYVYVATNSAKHMSCKVSGLAAYLSRRDI